MFNDYLITLLLFAPENNNWFGSMKLLKLYLISYYYTQDHYSNQNCVNKIILHE